MSKPCREAVAGEVDQDRKPTGCRLDSSSHVAATWADRGILIDARTYGGLPVDDDGCMSPEFSWVSDIRLTGRRWVTSFGLRVGDPTTKLRKLYPNAPYLGWERRNEYYLVWRHDRCVFGCSANDLKFGVDYPRLTAQVKNLRVVAFWLPVGGGASRQRERNLAPAKRALRQEAQLVRLGRAVTRSAVRLRQVAEGPFADPLDP